MSDIAKLIDQPGGYRLSEGLHATRAGIRLDDRMVEVIAAWFQIDAGEAFDLCYQWLGNDGATYISNLWPWSDAAKRLRYQEGQPWCAVLNNRITCENFQIVLPLHEEVKPLNRAATLFCDDAAAFAVLYWCITELGGEDES